MLKVPNVSTYYMKRSLSESFSFKFRFQAKRQSIKWKRPRSIGKCLIVATLTVKAFCDKKSCTDLQNVYRCTKKISFFNMMGNIQKKVVVSVFCIIPIPKYGSMFKHFLSTFFKMTNSICQKFIIIFLK